MDRDIDPAEARLRYMTPEERGRILLDAVPDAADADGEGIDTESVLRWLECGHES